MTLNFDAIRFLKRLKRNNSRDWFDAHRAEYEDSIKRPSRFFLEELKPLLLKLHPHLEIGPRSIYRINRDTRFTDDKTPYKTWIGFLFHDRRFKKDEAPALYLGLDPTGLALGAGMWRFLPLQRAVFRERVVTEPSESGFARAIAVARRGRFQLRGSELKKIPQGYDAEHRHAKYLKHNGLHAVRELDLPRSFGSAAFAREVARRFEPSIPLMEWMSTELRGLHHS